MSKQNRLTVFMGVVVLIVILIFLMRGGHHKVAAMFGMKGGAASGPFGGSGSDSSDPSLQDSMGEPVATEGGGGASPETIQKIFGSVIVDLIKCLDLRVDYKESASPVQVETLLNLVQQELGPASMVDRWTGWHLRNREGKERRLRLEITETDEGKMGHELHYYAVDKDGQAVPLELEPSQSNNPSDAAIKELLSQGEVFYRERAAAALFPTGERIEFVDKNGSLEELEFLRSDRIFRCSSVKNRDSCQCVK